MRCVDIRLHGRQKRAHLTAFYTLLVQHNPEASQYMLWTLEA